MKAQFGRQPVCDPIPIDTRPITGKPSSIGDPEWGMYVTPDDPARDTPEKARVYYENLFRLMGITPPATTSDADIAAAKRVLGA